MRSTELPRERYNFLEMCFPEEAAGLRQLARYWPLDLDLHEQKLEQLRQNPRARWQRYIRSLPMRHLATSAAASTSERLWIQIAEEVDQVSPPNASPTDENGVLMSWTRSGHHLEVEVMNDGTYEWFYRHRASHTDDGGSESDDIVPDTLFERLRQVMS
ncbi:MAG: hypothetical protein JOZ54_11060 [Acidobacteria bacterium]|nr:hypothetical protein [Acidobacteriota bacterium]